MPDNSLVEAYAGLEGRDLIKSVLRNHVGKTALVSSFGAESAVLLHMVSEIDPHLPVIFLDTGKLFQETLDYRDKLIAELGAVKLCHGWCLSVGKTTDITLGCGGSW